MDPQSGQTRPTVPTAPAAPTAPRRKGEARPAPDRDTAFDHLSIDALRIYRRALSDEESQVSYWRRILQARLDVVQAGSTACELETSRLSPVLTQARVGAGRQVLITLLPVNDIPVLPHLAELWERRVPQGDGPGQAALVKDLQTAEVELSTYRSALHRNITAATGELIARYREQPGLCLSALPLDRRSA